MDEVGAWTIISYLGRFGITREISIRYLKPVPTNMEIIAEGRIISHDEKHAVLHTTIHYLDRALLAEGESKWVFAKLSTVANLSGLDEPTLKHFLERSSQKEKGT
jgi:acyl-CoA thioesterase FadM